MASDGDDTDLPVIPARGRARSHSMHESTAPDLAAEINAIAVGGPPASSIAGGADCVPRGATTGKLSQKTLSMLTDLTAAAGGPPEYADERILSEEELAEKELISAAPTGMRNTSTGAVGTRVKARGGEGGEHDVLVKLLLLGDGGVGKTSLMMRFSEDKFSSSLLATAGVDYKTQFLDIEGKRVKCQSKSAEDARPAPTSAQFLLPLDFAPPFSSPRTVWDTAGQQRFHVITQAYYKNAHGIVLVYDASDPTEESFHNVRYWMENINKHASPTSCKMLIGNKIDVKGHRIDTSRGQALADEYKNMRFFETSAKDGTHVSEAFHAVARDAVLKILAAGGADSGPVATVSAVAARRPAAASGGAGASASVPPGSRTPGSGGKDGKCTIQ